MSRLREALIADREGNHLEAANRYEQALARQPDSLELWINATILYWRSLDFDYLCRHSVSRAFMERARARHRQMASQLPGAFPGEPLADFWSRYIRMMTGDFRFSPVEAAELISEADTPHLEPVILGSTVLSPRLQHATCARLLAHYRGSATARARYVTSAVDGIVERLRALERMN